MPNFTVVAILRGFMHLQVVVTAALASVHQAACRKKVLTVTGGDDALLQRRVDISRASGDWAMQAGILPVIPSHAGAICRPRSAARSPGFEALDVGASPRRTH
jgi:hypothetical protein